MNSNNSVIEKTYRSFLHERLDFDMNKLSEDWVSEMPLREVCVLFLLSLNNKKSLANPHALALLINRLKNQEVDVGGPYQDNHMIDLITNVFIYQILSIYKIHLPKLNEYLIEKINSNENTKIPYKLFFSWPSSVSEPANKQPTDTKAKPFFKEYSESLNFKAGAVIDKIYKHDMSGEIKNFSSIFYESLKTPVKLDKKILAQLDDANLYAWLAYIIYDDIIDENSNQEFLPLANISQRKAYGIYRDVGKYLDIDPKFIIDAFDTVDESLDQELKYKVKNYNSLINVDDFKIDDVYLSNKSIGHPLGPMIVARTQNYEKNLIKKIDDGFKNYIIAKQLCDDLKDFEQDIKAGLITYPIYKSFSEVNSRNSNEFLLQIRANFWEYGLETTALHAINKIDKSIKIFDTICKKNSILQTDVLYPVAESLKNILKHHQEKKEFFVSYSKVQ